MADTESQFKLEKYGLFVGGKALSGGSSDWKIYSGSDANLKLTISNNHHLLVSYNNELLENISLWNCASWMKALTKGDSMLLTNKYQASAHRRIKMQFAGEDGVVNRRRCADMLAKYFPVVTDDPNTVHQVTKISEAPKELQGNVTVNQIAKVLTEVESTLPSIYNSTPLPTESLEALVNLCLTDVNFPAFVHSVNEQITKLTQ